MKPPNASVNLDILHNIQRIVVGYNENDLAVTKRFWRFDMAGKAGATSLGCNLPRGNTTEIQVTIDALKKKDQDNILIPVDFTANKCKRIKEEHGLYYYLLREESMTVFLKEIFE